MVSRDAYLRTYSKIMLERGQFFRERYDQKRAIDAQVLSSKTITPQQQASLLELLGKDSFFRKGTRKQQSLRHFVWKIKKSSVLLLEHQRKSQQALFALAQRDAEVERLSALTNDEMRASIHTLTALESIYEQETAVLSALDVQGYLRLLAQESKAIHAFQTQRAGVYYAGTIFQQVFVARIKAAEKSPGLFLAASMGAIGTSLIALGMSLSMLFLKLYGLHIFTMQEVTFFYETLLVGNVTALLGFVGSQAVIDWSVVEQLHDDARSL